MGLSFSFSHLFHRLYQYLQYYCFALYITPYLDYYAFLGALSEMLHRQLDKYEWISLIISLILTVSIFVNFSIYISKTNQKFFCQFEYFNCQEQITSFGQKYLIDADSQIKNKQNRKDFQDFKGKGIEDFRKGDYFYASENFNKAFKQFSDPETLIYKNNAEAAKAKHQYIQIAVSVPISQEKESDIAQEILRGVAQAQNEVNESKKRINGKWLQVGIADDKNDPKRAQEVAEEAVKNPNIIAMVGHNASRVSQKVADIYEKGKLVMITPTSYALNITYNSQFIYKIVPNVNILVEKLKKHYEQVFLNNGNGLKNNLLICYDSDEEVSNIFKQLFLGITGVNYDEKCNLSDAGVKAEKAVSEAPNFSTDSLLLAASAKKIDSFISLIKVNQGKRQLFSNPTLHTEKTLKQAKEFTKNMVLVTPWHPTAFPKNPVVENFMNNAKILWQVKVNWRTAGAYDATKVIIEGLKKISQESNTQELRYKLQQQVKNTNKLCGATGAISFTSGERNEHPAFIIKVVKDENSDTGYKFELDSSANDNYITEPKCYPVATK
jgi:branched-chain amino acid transport system substrate-binding protein